LLIGGKEGVEDMTRQAEEQAKKKGLRLVATFGTVTLVALGALAVGMMNPKDGKTPNNIDLNATPTPGVSQVQEGKQDVAKAVTPVPTAVPEADTAGKQTMPTGDVKQQTADATQTAEVTQPEDAAVLNPDGVMSNLNFSAETGMLWPVTGEALLSFSPEHAVYHKTLDSYRTTDYVLLAGEVGTHVSAAADGVVTAVKEELWTGTTVTMKVSPDHEIVYGMLSDVTVKEGDFVDAGTVFATVAEPTRYYAEDGSGVYVQVLKQGEAMNPMLFLQ